MDLVQNKLSKSEWQSIEVQINRDELNIVKMICESFHNINHSYNMASSLLSHVKITPSKEIHQQLYIIYFDEYVRKLIKKYMLDITPISIKGCKIKSADKIRIKHTGDSLMQQKNNIFEFNILDKVTFMLKEYKKKQSSWISHYYTINRLLKYNIREQNVHVVEFIKAVLKLYDTHVNLYNILCDATHIIEENKCLLKYADVALYNHQKELFSVCKHEGPKLVLYIAPTGTGKTLSPLGLSEKSRIIFMCAARHVGLALAKNAISCNKKVAFAFGCNDTSDIRLHYFSAKEYTRNRRSGSIQKVDNSIGDKVEIMICDIKSYKYAMNYMHAFNELKDIILYWDEPTITLDYEQHDLHEMISRNWHDNIIPNIVLSSATLPKQDEIMPTIMNFKRKFACAEISNIISHDCKKTISILDKENKVALPHLQYADYTTVQTSIKYCKNCKTLLRYLDLGEIVKFIDFVNQNEFYSNKRYDWSFTFASIDDITMDNIKLYYLDLLEHIQPSKWEEIYKHCISSLKPRYESSIHITASDAHTLTDGPTIFLSDNVDKIAKFYLKDSNIPMEVVHESYNAIKFNNILNKKLNKLEHDIEDTRAKDEEKDKKKAESRVSPEVLNMMQQADELRRCVKPSSFHDIFIPNKKSHVQKWAPLQIYGNQYSSDISESIVEKIMMLHDVDDSWKILLLMGIGVLMQHKSIAYMEIMKQLANDQKLYLIIASSDFIYGTNYQFCHGYISQDLKNMTQEKTIQALGRIGRKNIQQTYSIRLRSNDIIDTLFLPQSNKPEVINMNKLFG